MSQENSIIGKIFSLGDSIVGALTNDKVKPSDLLSKDFVKQQVTNKVKSIKEEARRSIMYFPVLASDVISFEIARAVTEAVEARSVVLTRLIIERRSLIRLDKDETKDDLINRIMPQNFDKKFDSQNAFKSALDSSQAIVNYKIVNEASKPWGNPSGYQGSYVTNWDLGEFNDIGLNLEHASFYNQPISTSSSATSFDGYYLNLLETEERYKNLPSFKATLLNSDASYLELNESYVVTPWDKVYKVTDKQYLANPEEHPSYNTLYKREIDCLQAATHCTVVQLEAVDNIEVLSKKQAKYITTDAFLHEANNKRFVRSNTSGSSSNSTDRTIENLTISNEFKKDLEDYKEQYKKEAIKAQQKFQKAENAKKLAFDEYKLRQDIRAKYNLAAYNAQLQQKADKERHKLDLAKMTFKASLDKKAEENSYEIKRNDARLRVSAIGAGSTLSRIESKLNRSDPTVVNVNIEYKSEFSIQVANFSYGVKSPLHVIPSEEVVELLPKAKFENNFLIKVARLVTGEISFFKDFVFNLNLIKDGFKREKSGTSGWYSHLTYLARFNKNSPSTAFAPTVTILVSMIEVEEIYRRSNGKINLRKPFDVRKMLDGIGILNFIIVDEANEKVFWYDEDNKVFDHLSLTDLEIEVKSNMSKNDAMKMVIAAGRAKQL